MKPKILIFIFSLVLLGCDGANYFIWAPKTIVPGTTLDIKVKILNDNLTNVPIEASIQRLQYNYYYNFGRQVVENVTGVFSPGDTHSLSIPISKNIDCSYCMLHIRGLPPLQFEKEFDLQIQKEIITILVQTDKAIYKPKERVNIRILGVYSDLRLYEGTFHVEIKDSGYNNINVWNGLSSTSGVVEIFVDLSDQPVFGSWRIYVTSETIEANVIQNFDVAEYDLPRFEVIVTLPTFGLLTDSLLTGFVQAKYTSGQPVKALVELKIGENFETNECKRRAQTEVTFEIDGKESFTIPLEDIRRNVDLWNYKEVKVTAFVTEISTGVKQSASSVITYYYSNNRNKYYIKFLENTPDVFKPGLQYTAYIQVTTPDGLPPTDQNLTLSVYTLAHYFLEVPDQKFYSLDNFKGTYPLPGQHVKLPSSGILPIDINIPSNASAIEIKAYIEEWSEKKTVTKTFSKSNNYLQLTLLDKEVKPGNDIHVKITGTEKIDNVLYEIRSRGRSVVSGSIDFKGQNELIHTIKVTPAMGPTAQVLVYYFRSTDEIVADSIAFNVEGIFTNEVSVAFNMNETDVQNNVSLLLTADPSSQIFVLAVDQSVLLLKSGNDINGEKVRDAMAKYNKGNTLKDSDLFISNSATAVRDVFSNMDLNIATDLDLEVPYQDRNLRYELWSPFRYNYFWQYYENIDFQTVRNSEYKTPMDTVRRIFPETWLWTSTNSSSGRAEISATVPDTITSWVVSAFATNWDTGLGVAPTTAKLRVFRPFFVTLTYPRSLIRYEHAVVQATIFNYLPKDLKVTVGLKTQPFIDLLPLKDSEIAIQVPSNEQGVAYFFLNATLAGLFDIEVTASCELARDTIIRQIHVKHEGAPMVSNFPVFLNVTDEEPTFRKELDLVPPTSLVKDSERIRVKVTGDLIGSTLDSMESLLTLPTGCGEQSLVKFTPNIYIGQYLAASGQMTEKIRRNIVSLLSKGYQRLLTYKRYDDGFSAFGNYDVSSSTWLTAFVVTSFVEAQRFIYIDQNVILNAANWLVQRQYSSGSFGEIGSVLDRNTQGTSSGPALTAFVLTALMKARQITINENCTNVYICRKVVYERATLDAIRNLEELVQQDGIKDLFSLAVVTYALAETNSSIVGTALEKMWTFTKTEGNLQYWSVNSSDAAYPDSDWDALSRQAKPIDILITSYMILALTSLNKVQEAFPAVQWLMAQKNANGGFVSTQDTIVGLQALSAYATKVFKPNTNVAVTVVSADAVQRSFHINKDNMLSLQIQELEKNATNISILATGKGNAYLNIEYSFNSLVELSVPSFETSLVLLEDKLDIFNLMICTRLLSKKETGMVVQEISIPSGFAPDLSTLGKMAGVKRSERKGDLVAVYFDKITYSSLCYSIVMVRESKVANSQKNYIRTYEYYDPANQATVFYKPKAISKSTVCDICQSCC